MEANNVKAMRDACQKMLDLVMLRGDGKTRCILTWDEFNESQKMLRAVLSAPSRNCERFATWEETLSAFREETGNRKPLELWLKSEIQAFAIWLFAPATERKGGVDDSNG